MDESEERATALRAELEGLKRTLLITTDEVQRHEVHRRINICIRESLALIDQRLQNYRAAQTVPEEPERARQVGE